MSLSSEAITDREGRFTLELPQGVWELSFIASAFAAQTVTDVAVTSEMPLNEVLFVRSDD